MLATIPLDRIENGTRLRGISEAQVASLVDSIAAVGLLNPITVYARNVIRNGISVDGYGLVAGLHRKTACERLGLVEIEASVVTLGELERQIAECDENLCSTTLSKADRAMFTNRRKEAYEALHGPAKAKGAHAAHAAMGHDHDATAKSADAFTTDTAKKTGQATRTVRLDAERGAKVGNAALALLKGTPLDTGKYLDELKAVPADMQVAKVKADLAARKQSSGISRRFQKPAADPIPDHDATEKQVAALMSAWNKAGPEAREEFLRRIDTPVFDRAA